MSNISYKYGKERYHWFTCAVEFQQSVKNQTRSETKIGNYKSKLTIHNMTISSHTGQNPVMAIIMDFGS